MLGIVIVTHGTLSVGLKNAAEVIIGESNNIVTESLFEEDNIQELNKKIKQAMESVDQGDGVIIFTDIESASPYNQALIMVNQLDENKKQQVVVISGVNLPMLLESINHQYLKTPIAHIPDNMIKQASMSFNYWSYKSETVNEEDDF